MRSLLSFKILYVISILAVIFSYSYSKEANSAVKSRTTAKPETAKFGDIEMVKLPGGAFTMGCPMSEEGCQVVEIEHQVTLSSFWIGRYEVTQKQYREIMGINPSFFNITPENPVDNVNWYEAVEFCNRLSEKLNLKPYYKIDKDKKDPANKSESDKLKYTVTVLGGSGFRLPTEAEWEYACRGGTKTVFSYGNSLDSNRANFNGIYPYKAGKNIFRNRTFQAGSLNPNAYGLYDMHGNVWEWCWDWYGNFHNDTVYTDPAGDPDGIDRVIRGGGWYSEGKDLRSAARFSSRPNSRSNDMGFRLARSL